MSTVARCSTNPKNRFSLRSDDVTIAKDLEDGSMVPREERSLNTRSGCKSVLVVEIVKPPDTRTMEDGESESVTDGTEREGS